MTSKEEWDTAAFVKASEYRISILETLEDGPAIPAGIARETNKNISHISRGLRECREEGLVELLVPEDRHKNRVYAITEEGIQAFQLAEQIA